jgi:glycosyltransferase involved in cell wall biosynthesis
VAIMDCDKNIKITVIIPVYNDARFLPKSLDSVLSQTLKEIEVICINDGSTDGSLKVLQKYRQSDHRVHIYSIPNSGSGKARNLGLRKARGEFIAFLDADDWYFEADALQVLYEKAKEKKVDICGGSLCYASNGYINFETEKQQFQTEGYVRFEDYQNCQAYQRFIYRTELLRKNHICFPYYLRYQDPPFMLNAMLAAGTFYAVDKVVYSYHLRPEHVNWNVQKICDKMRGMAYLLHVSKERHFEVLHLDVVQQQLWDKGHIFYIADLKNIDIRKAMEGIEREADYDLIYREGILKRNETIKSRILLFAFRNEINKFILQMSKEKRNNLSTISNLRGLADKHLTLFLMMNQWVKVKQKGKNLASYFEKNGFHTIAIYGMSYAGETLLDELKDTKIKVAYAIDKKVDSIYADVDIVSMDDDFEEVDAIVVTAITFFDEIEKTLSQKVDCPIISLEDILYDT